MIALDLFAGHGWGVACQRLGIEEYGVEIMPEARAIRAANGMRTPFADVWDVLLHADPASPEFRAALQVASPPCQTFSMAGGGAGRRALDEVLALIDERAYLRPADLHAFGEKHDPRTALVLTPLAMVARDVPTYVVWEQVPPVLPVWERAAAEMREWGYSVWTGVVNAEQYGVPQTRRRAVLIARADGKEAVPPMPTHSRYYSHDPKRLDPDVLPWVSMAEALGWGMTERPMVTAGNAIGRAEGIGGSGGKAAIEREKGRGAWTHVERHRGAGMLKRGGDRPARPVDEPAPTVTGNASGTTPGGFRKVMRSSQSVAGGPRAERPIDSPALTVTTNTDRAQWTRPAPTVTSGWAATGGAEVFGRRSRATMPEGATRVTVAEAAALQSYPADFVWDVMVDTPRGPRPITKTKQFLTIGNAVPPLMAEAILKAAIS